MVKKTKYNLFKGTAYIVLFLLSIDASAQEHQEKQLFIFNNQLKFSISPVLYNKLEINNTGEKLINSRPCFSGEIAISLYQYIKNGFGINIGAGFGIAPFNIKYNFKSPSGSIFNTGPNKEYYDYLSFSNSTYIQDFYVFPVSIQKIFNNKKNTNHYYSCEFGIKFNKKIAYPYEISGGDMYVIDDTTDAQLFNFSINNTNNRNIISYFIKFGINNVNKKHNSFHINFVIHYSTKEIGVGWYKFYNLKYDSYGSIKQNINYIGFEFIYGLNFRKINK